MRCSLKGRFFSNFVYQYRYPIIGFTVLLLITWYFLLSPNNILSLYSGERIVLTGKFEDQLSSISNTGKYLLRPGLKGDDCMWVQGGRDADLKPVLTVQYFSGGSCSSFPIRTEEIPREAGITFLESRCICGAMLCPLTVTKHGSSFDYSLGGCG